MSAGFAEIVAERLVGKFVEIYQGNKHNEHHYNEYNDEIKTIKKTIRSSVEKIYVIGNKNILTKKKGCLFKSNPIVPLIFF